MGCSCDKIVNIENIRTETDEGLDQFVIPIEGRDYPQAEPPMRQDFKEPVKWLEEDEEEMLADCDELETLTEVEATQNRLMGNKNYVGMRLSDIDKHAKSIHQDLLTVRAIIVWLANQDTNDTKYGKGTLDTPLGYLQLIKEKRATFAALFTTLCRYAGVKCTFIHGICRGGDYQPGDQDTNQLECIWVAVRVDGNWQIIHPYWVCRAMIGKTVGGWIKLEMGGNSIARPEHATPGTIQTTFKESYFMPRPEVFKYLCYPNDTKWMLLPPDQVIKSREEFLALPYLLPEFFGLGLSLTSQNCCVLDSKNGLVDIVIRCNRNSYKNVVMTYDLFIRDVSEEMLKVENMPRLVLNSRCEERFNFQIRFPLEGTYKIVFYAGFYGKPLLRICEFKLNCSQRNPNCKPLPLDTQFPGRGPNLRTEKAALLFPSVMGGVINVKVPASTHSSAKSDGDETTAQIRSPITSQGMRENDYAAEMDVPQRKARKRLKAAMSKPELEELAIVIDKCHKARISDDDDDVRAAKNKLGYLKMKAALQDCHNRRNLDVTSKTLQQVSTYRHKLALIIETRKAEKLQEQLLELGGFTREVPQLKVASEELVYNANPSAEVRSTMKALFLLLGEPADTLKDWSHIQYLLKFSHGQKNNVLIRMKDISERQIDQKTRRKIAAVLHTYSEIQVRNSSQAAASFYRWVEGVLRVLGPEKTTLSA